MTPIHDTADLVSKALRRAWQLGQTYWQQADSEYQSQWKKADATQAIFDQLVEDTRAAILTSNSGAQPAPSINEGVRKVTLDFRWESEAQHHIPTIEIEFEPVSPESPNDAKSWQDRDRLAAMLTPEAKP